MKHGSPAGAEGIPADAAVSLTPTGRALFNQLIDAASAEAGRNVTGEDLLEVLRRVREETGVDAPEFTDPAMMACLKKHLRAIGREQTI